MTVGILIEWKINKAELIYNPVNLTINTMVDNQANKKRENEMWGILLDEQMKLDKSKNTAIIVDSDLDKLDDYNGGKPYTAKKKLPKKFKFIYASADAGGSVTNEFIKACDTIANWVLDEFIKDKANYQTPADVLNGFEKYKTLIPKFMDKYWTEKIARQKSEA